MWGPTTERSAVGATSVATLTEGTDLGLVGDEGTDLGTVGYRGYICRHPNTRPGRLVGLRPVCPGHHMVPERLVGLRLVCSGLRGSRGTAGRCCGQYVREILPRSQRNAVLGKSIRSSH